MLMKVNPRKGDDPSFHEGRIRGQPHVAGQWPTHAYIEFRPADELLPLLERIVEAASSLRKGVHSLLFTEFGNVAPLHVSLSRPLVFWTWEKEDFFESFSSTVRGLKYPIHL
jgi:hypothetical protein